MIQMQKQVFAVILARNEENSIGEIISRTRPFVDQVVIVDGHSSDNTRAIAEKEGIRVLLDHGKGKGDGIRTAIQQVDCDIIVFMDADGSHDPNDIPKLVGPILEDKADMVVGSRGQGEATSCMGIYLNCFE